MLFTNVRQKKFDEKFERDEANRISLAVYGPNDGGQKAKRRSILNYAISLISPISIKMN